MENLLANLDRVKGKLQEKLREFADQARLSKQLVTLRDDVPLDLDYDSFALTPPDNAALTALFKEMEFHKLLQEFSSDERATGEGYRGVLDEAELDAGWSKRCGRPNSFAFDTETTSLDAVRADLVGLSFAVRPGEAWYLPGRALLPGRSRAARSALGCWRRLRPLFTGRPGQRPRSARTPSTTPWCCAGPGSRCEGIAVDTMLASYLANPAANSHGMDAWPPSCSATRPSATRR